MEQALQVGKQKFGLSGAVLKMIAVITMLIDHTGAAIFENLILPKMGAYSGYVSLYTSVFTGKIEPEVLADPNFKWILLTFIMRQIGRIAFPIFCFLLVEGFFHTRNIKKYALTMAIFTLLSEIPFDLALFGEISLNHQNVYFTLLIGLLTMMAIKYLEGDTLGKKALQILAGLSGLIIARLLNTDYGAFGILLILILYIFRSRKAFKCILGAVSFSWEITSVISFILIPLYNGKRGRQMKYFFYAFYPVHLIVLYFIANGIKAIL